MIMDVQSLDGWKSLFIPDDKRINPAPVYNLNSKARAELGHSKVNSSEDFTSSGISDRLTFRKPNLGKKSSAVSVRRKRRLTRRRKASFTIASVIRVPSPVPRAMESTATDLRRAESPYISRAAVASI